jgi:hypothetical protein
MEEYEYGVIMFKHNILWCFKEKQNDTQFEIFHYDSVKAWKDKNTNTWTVRVQIREYEKLIIVKTLNMSFKEMVEYPPIIPKS